jgi:hypothetical protein
MTNAQDIWRAASLLIAQHGGRAAKHAVRRRVSELSLQGDAATVAVWSDILVAVHYLQERHPPPDDLPH